MSKQQIKFSISDLLGFFFIFIINQFVLISLFSLLKSIISLPLKNLTTISALAATPISFLLLIVWIEKSKKVELPSVIRDSQTNIQLIIALLISTSGLNIMLSEINNITNNFWPLREEIISKLNQILFTDSKGLIITLLVLTTITIILEEFLLRGLILRGLLSNYKTEIAILTTMTFEVLINFSFHNLLTTLTISLLLSWLYIQNKSLLNCIIANLFFNLIPPLLIYFTSIRIPGFNTKLSTATQFQPVWFNLIGIILFFSGSWLLLKKLKGTTTKL
ncbi:MAG: CPBP family glutamic-type intramembrane protease [Bacillota bacterium]